MTITLAEVVASVESGGDSWACRREPTVYAKYLLTDDQTQNAIGAKIRQFEEIHNCSPDTARDFLSMSWGAYQMMGFNLSEHVLKFVADPARQLVVFEERAVIQFGATPDQLPDASWLLTDPAAALAFATRYNGDGAAYLPRLRAAYTSLVDAAASA